MSHDLLTLLLLCLFVNSSKCVEVACSNDTNVKAVCECTERTRRVNCTNRGLNEWPVGIPVNTLVLYFSDNNLKKIDTNALLELQELISINLANNSLTSLPKFPMTITSLNIGYNNLKKIDDDALLDLHKLTSINLNNNLLTSLPRFPKTILSVYAMNNMLTEVSTCFNDLPLLRTVNISHNSISILKSTTFKGSNLVDHLYISSNHILGIEPFTFVNMQLNLLRIQDDNEIQVLVENTFALNTDYSVEVLVQYNPNLEKISTGTFKNITTGSIYLNGNSLQSIPARAFQGEYFIEISLAENKIRFIDKDAFVAVYYVHKLQLSNNKLTELPNIINLQIGYILDLSWNNLTSLEDDRIPTVTNILLHENNIQHISKNIFSDMASLDKLMLMGNNITSIQEGAFIGTNLQFLFLYGNGITNITYQTLKTNGKTLKYIYLFDNKLEKIGENAFSHMTENGTIYLNCGGLQSLPNGIEKHIKTICVTDNTEININIVGDILHYIDRGSGLACNSETGTCSLCKKGTYKLLSNLNYKPCTKCPPGGFYQDKLGVIERIDYNETCQKCPIGSFSNNAGAASIADCQTCPSGTDTSTFANLNACYCLDKFHRTDRFGPCMPCPMGVTCEGGYQNITRGYWWSWDFTCDCIVDEEQNKSSCLSAYNAFIINLQNNNFPLDDPNQLKNAVYKGPLPQIHLCPLRKKSCSIGLELNDTCAKGYTGWLCAACSKGYYQLFNECHKCQGPLLTVITFICVIFVTFGVICLIWRLQQRSTDHHQKTKLDSFVTYLKIAINFYQILGILSEVTEIHWPKNYEYAGRIVQYFDIIRYISMLSPRCLFESWNAYSSLQVAISTPVFIVITMSTFYLMFYTWNKCHGVAIAESRTRDKCIVVSMLLFYLTYANICADIMAVGPWSIRLYNVTEDGNVSKTVLTSDYSIDLDQNDGSTYQINKTLVYISLTYIIGFPLVIVLMLYCLNVHCDQHEENQDQGRMIGVRFFCGQYKHKFWFWESFELYNKALLALIANLKDDVSSSLSYSLFFTVIFIVLHLYLQPMKEKSEQRFQLLTLVFIVVNLSIGAIVNLDQNVNIDDVIGLLHKITPVILIMLNVSIMLIVIVDFFKKLKTDCCRQESGALLLQIDDDDFEESHIEENNVII
ncbi:uncharacterized protein [Antedon mediterranea]|uniref:uncharacterized protein n=1 Tax=Antedon mediterranea TaxID=105859 RepID=UPI003AF7373A